MAEKLQIEWSSRHWSLLVGLVIGAVLAVSSVLVLVYGEGLVTRGFALVFALSGMAWVYVAVREYFWQRTYFLHADASELRWGHSRAAPTVVSVANLKRVELHFESSSQGFHFETRDGRSYQWSLLKRERLAALHEHLKRTCSAEIILD